MNEVERELKKLRAFIDRKEAANRVLLSPDSRRRHRKHQSNWLPRELTANALLLDDARKSAAQLAVTLIK